MPGKFSADIFHMSDSRPSAPPHSLVVTAWLVLAGTALLIPFGRTQLGASVSFMPAVISVVGCFDLLSVCLLLGGYRDKGDLRLLMMAGAYGWSLVAMAGYALAVPQERSPVPAVRERTVHGAVPVPGLARRLPGAARAGVRAVAAPGADRHRRRAAHRDRVAADAVAVGTASVLIALVVGNAPHLPVLIVGVDTTRMTALTAPVALPLVLGALVVSWLGSRRRIALDGWATVAILVCACDLVLTYASGHRYSLGWYGGRLLTLVAAGVVVLSMLATFRRLAAVAEHHAAHDALTGLANRRRAYDELDQMIARARFCRRALGLVSLDLDHFKRINDEHGARDRRPGAAHGGDGAEATPAAPATWSPGSAARSSWSCCPTPMRPGPRRPPRSSAARWPRSSCRGWATTCPPASAPRRWSRRPRQRPAAAPGGRGAVRRQARRPQPHRRLRGAGPPPADRRRPAGAAPDGRHAARLSPRVRRCRS